MAEPTYSMLTKKVTITRFHRKQPLSYVMDEYTQDHVKRDTLEFRPFVIVSGGDMTRAQV